MTPPVLTIAGSDPSGGAGIQADLKVFHQHHTYGMAVLTLLTVQNTKEVKDVRVLDHNFVLEQLNAVLDDIPPRAAKTGALGSAANIDALAYRAESFSFPLIVDPVMVSKHGSLLIDTDAEKVLRKELIPRAYLVTPNLPEAQVLSEREIRTVADMEKAARTISLLGIRNVLIKGGHLQDQATDLLYLDGTAHQFPAPRVETENTHGTGCTYSSAIAARLAYGQPLLKAVALAKQYISRAISTNPGLGGGQGPVNHFAAID